MNALIIVDVQNDFADPAGGLYVTGGELLPALINEQLPSYNYTVYTQDWHPAETSHFGEDSWPPHCIADTWGAELHPELYVPDGSTFIRKGTQPDEDGYSAFNGEVNGETISTGLAEHLEELDVTGVFIAGIAFDVCVRATALDALALGLDTVVLGHLTASVDGSRYDEIAHEIKLAGGFVQEL